MQRLDDGQRRNRSGFARGGDHGTDGPRSAEIYRELTREFGEPLYDRVEAPATSEQKKLLAKLSPSRLSSQTWLAKKSRPSSPARLATARPSAG